MQYGHILNLARDSGSIPKRFIAVDPVTMS
jgi:hypothetical protein